MARPALKQPPVSAQVQKTKAARLRKSVQLVKDAPMLQHDRSGNSKYRPEYCDLVETLGAQGKSRMQCASLLHVDRNTLANWERQYPDFGRAIARAMAASQAWWEAKAQQSLGKKQFQAQLWRYSMAGRFKEDYAEKPSQGLADALPDFLAAITEAAEIRKQKALAAKDDAASRAQDVVVDIVKVGKATD